MGKVEKFSKEKENEIIKMYVNENKTQKEIANYFGTYNTSIRRVLLRNNITIRSNSELLSFVKLENLKNKEGTESFDYFLGILATDGCITDDRIVLDFSEENKEILNYWNDFLGNKCNITMSIHKVYKTPQYRIAFRSSDISEYLKTFGIIPRKTSILCLKYINWSVLRGIIDGDGCIVLDKRQNTIRVNITSGSEVFLEQIQSFLLENKIISYIHPTQNHFNLSVNVQEFVYKMWLNLYKNATYFLRRKYEKYGPVVKKFSTCNTVNSEEENSNSNSEPSPS